MATHRFDSIVEKGAFLCWTHGQHEKVMAKITAKTSTLRREQRRQSGSVTYMKYSDPDSNWAKRDVVELILVLICFEVQFLFSGRLLF